MFYDTLEKIPKETPIRTIPVVNSEIPDYVVLTVVVTLKWKTLFPFPYARKSIDTAHVDVGGLTELKVIAMVKGFVCAVIAIRTLDDVHLQVVQRLGAAYLVVTRIVAVVVIRNACGHVASCLCPRALPRQQEKDDKELPEMYATVDQMIMQSTPPRMKGVLFA